MMRHKLECFSNVGTGSFVARGLTDLLDPPLEVEEDADIPLQWHSFCFVENSLVP